eukprot:scaffold21458_cov167-Amphora_coffeaeformis.AAC.4
MHRSFRGKPLYLVLGPHVCARGNGGRDKEEGGQNHEKCHAQTFGPRYAPFLGQQLSFRHDVYLRH